MQINIKHAFRKQIFKFKIAQRKFNVLLDVRHFSCAVKMPKILTLKNKQTFFKVKTNMFETNNNENPRLIYQHRERTI